MIVIGGYTILADVGSSILKLLRDNMTPEPIPKQEMIGLASPADKGDFRLTMYLYSINEVGEFIYPEMRNVGLGLQQYPPLVVNLYYLLTAYSTAELNSRALDEHRILARSIQVIYDNAVLRDSVLQGVAAERNEEIRITRNNLSIEQLTDIWNRFVNVPYKLSMAYIVGPVNIDSTRIKETRRVTGMEVNIKG